MEKEVKKKRTTKKAKEEQVAQTLTVQPVEETPKKARKPRAKKEVAAEKIEEVKAEVEPKKEEKKPKQPRAKKTAKTEEKPVEEGKEEKHELTRQEKKDAVRAIVKELLEKGNLRRSALIDETSKLYAERFPSAETINANDVKGRVGSVITLMEQAKEVFYVDGVMRLEEPQKIVLIKEEKADNLVPAPTKEEILPVPVSEGKLAPVFDMSALLGEKSKGKKQEKEQPPAEETPAKKKTEKTTAKKEKGVTDIPEKITVKKLPKPKTQDKLKEKFLKKIRDHGGSYLEYYAVYLLERYAQRNGRRLEALRVSGGEYDGGIDGELELTDKFGFRETLYIQAKNWAPTDEKWMVGETLLQQFIGAVTYRQAQRGKVNCRGVYVTTSLFSEGAKKMLDKLSDKFVGYDGNDLFDLAKECEFGLIKKGDEWALDENLLSGEKAFFNM